jgi:hypothetical protein
MTASAPHSVEAGSAVRILAGPHIGRRAIVDAVRPEGVSARIVSVGLDWTTTMAVELPWSMIRPASRFGLPASLLARR